MDACSAGLLLVHGVQGVASSNPAAPTNLFMKIRYSAKSDRLALPRNRSVLNTCWILWSPSHRSDSTT